MTQPTACGEPCATCPGATTCPEHVGDGTRIDLADALARCEREAIRGVCDTGRYRMRYYTWGAGPPLVFIHGVCETGRAFVLPISRLARHFRCVAYDLPNGRDDGADLRRLTHADLVADLWALLDHLGIDRAYILGSSFGSTVALAALHARPERLPRGILQGGLAWRPLRPAEWLAARLGCWLPCTVGRLPGRAALSRAMHQWSFRDHPEMWERFQQWSGEAPARSLARQALLLHRLDLRPLLPAIRQPVLLITGEDDRIVGRECEEVLLRGLPNAGQVVLEGCGHVPMYSHPEMFAAVVRRFLTPPSAG